MKKILTTLALVSTLGLTACNDTSNTLSLNQNQQAFVISELIQSGLEIFSDVGENTGDVNTDFEDVVLDCEGGGTVTLSGTVSFNGSFFSADAVAIYDNCVRPTFFCDFNLTLDGTVSALVTTVASETHLDSLITISESAPLILTANGESFTLIGADLEYSYDSRSNEFSINGGDVTVEDGRFNGSVIPDRTVNQVCSEF